MTDSSAAHSPRVWVLADERTGDVSQVLGVAEALGMPFAVKHITYEKTARLHNALRADTLIGVSAASREQLTPPWPDLVIGAGRRTVPVGRWIKRKSGGHSLLVQIMWPGALGAAHFDLLVVPRHDGIAGHANLLEVTGAPHRVTPARLAAEAETWRPRFEGLPRPWIGVLVGGALRRGGLTREQAQDFAAAAADMARRSGGALLVSTSRRTGRKAEAAVRAAMADLPGFVYSWRDNAGGGDNPFFGLLACADALVITGDSVSMCSEACGTGKPVYIFDPRSLTGPKHRRLHRELYALGHARPLDRNVPLDWSHPPLNAAPEIAAAIRRLLAAGA